MIASPLYIKEIIVDVLPEITDIVVAVFLIGIAVFGITQVIKTISRAIVPKAETDPLWWQAAFRIIPISLGTLLGGYTLEWPWGLLIGMSSGVLAAALYVKAKQLVSSFKVPDDDFS